MFDTIMVPCPECGQERECQSKNGDCVLGVYSMRPGRLVRNGGGEVDFAAVRGVNSHAPFTCRKCGTVFFARYGVFGFQTAVVEGKVLPPGYPAPTMPYDEVVMGAGDEPKAFFVIQRGGSTYELYFHGFDSREDAEDYRVDCRDSGAYETSPVMEIAVGLADHPDFPNVVEGILGMVRHIDYPDEDEFPPKEKGGDDE